MHVTSPLEANVWKVLVQVRERVSAGQVLAILESMKMEIPVESPVDGVVSELAVVAGGNVADGGLIAVVE